MTTYEELEYLYKALAAVEDHLADAWAKVNVFDRYKRELVVSIEELKARYAHEDTRDGRLSWR